MKNKYLIAIDLDGTVIQGFDNYDKKSFELLKKLAEEHYIVIATGRPYRSSKYYYDLLGLKTPIINYNGALVQNPHDPDFFKSMITFNRNILIDLIKDNEDILINVFCEIEDDIFLWKDTKEIVPFLHLEGGTLNVGNLDLILRGDPNGAIILSKLGSEERLKTYIKNKYHEHLSIRFWHNKEIVIAEVYNPLTSKGNALMLIARYYEIPRKQIIAIGDGHNDIEMIQMAGLGVAMGNSHPELLEVAKEKIKTVEENGVYHFLNNFFNEK